MANLEKITKSEKGNFVGHISIHEKQVFQGMNIEINQYYFVRLSDDSMAIGEIKDFDLKAWDIEPSTTDDGSVFKWITPKI